MKIDWLEGTIHGIGIESALKQLRAMFPDWRELDYGGRNYECSAVVLGTGRVFWSPSRPQNGVHFVLPPSAMELSDLDYLSFAQRVNAWGTKFTRVDLAADDTLKGILDMETIRAAVEAKHFVSIAKKKPKEIIDHEGAGRTFYFGRGQSQTLIRIYDKEAEQRARGKLYVGHWVRVEMQLRGKRANAAVQYILEHPDDWQTQARGWLLAALDFKIPGEGSNKSCWATAEWWLTFLDFASKLRIFISRRILTIEDVKNWVEQQIGPYLFVLQAVYGKDILSDIANRSATRLTKKHLALIAQGCAYRFTKDDETQSSD